MPEKLGTSIRTGGDTLVPDHGPVTDKRGGDYDSRNDAERIAVNVATLYCEFASDATSPNPAQLFALMGEIWKCRRG